MSEHEKVDVDVNEEEETQEQDDQVEETQEESRTASDQAQSRVDLENTEKLSDEEYAKIAVPARNKLFSVVFGGGLGLLAAVMGLLYLTDYFNFEGMSKLLIGIRLVVGVGIPGLIVALFLYPFTTAEHRQSARYSGKTISGSLIIFGLVTALTTLGCQWGVSKEIGKTVVFLASVAAITFMTHARRRNIWTYASVLGLLEGVLVYFNYVHQY